MLRRRHGYVSEFPSEIPIKQLEKEGLIARSGRSRRSLTITDWPGLQARADFNTRYLHLDQATGTRIARR